jgi:hypothetical protein
VAVQRASSDLKLNPHLHAVFLDGVYVPSSDGATEFRALPRLSTTDVADALQVARARILRYLEQRRVITFGSDTDSDVLSVSEELAERDPALAQLAAAAVSGLAPAGPERRHKPSELAFAGRPGVVIDHHASRRPPRHLRFPHRHWELSSADGVCSPMPKAHGVSSVVFLAGALVGACRMSSTDAASGTPSPASATVPSTIPSSPGVPPSDSTVSSQTPGIVTGSVLRAYQLQHLGNEVNGGGFAITSKDGRMMNASGHLLEGLPDTFPTPLREEQARDLAFRAQEFDAQPPWLAKPAVWHPPRGKLIWAPTWLGAKPGDYVLAWSFDFKGTGASRYPNVIIDATTGRVVVRNSGFVN